jgi:hypothetical protein
MQIGGHTVCRCKLSASFKTASIHVGLVSISSACRKRGSVSKSLNPYTIGLLRAHPTGAPSRFNAR